MNSNKISYSYCEALWKIYIELQHVQKMLQNVQKRSREYLPPIFILISTNALLVAIIFLFS